MVYAGPPERAAAWFCLGLGYTYERGRDGALSDWLMDLVSVRFAKPCDLASRCGPSWRCTMHCPFTLLIALKAHSQPRLVTYCWSKHWTAS